MVRALASLPPAGKGGTGTSYNGLYGEAKTKRGTFFMLLVYEMVRVCCWFSASTRGFSLGSPIFPSQPKTNLSKVQFDPEQTDAYKFLATSKCSVGKQITNYQFICLFF